MRFAPSACGQHVPGDEPVSTDSPAQVRVMLASTQAVLKSSLCSFAPNVSFTVFTGDAVDDAVWDAGRDVSGASLCRETVSASALMATVLIS